MSYFTKGNEKLGNWPWVSHVLSPGKLFMDIKNLDKLTRVNYTSGSINLGNVTLGNPWVTLPWVFLFWIT